MCNTQSPATSASRFNSNGPKVSTLVKYGSEVIFSNGDKYEVEAMINHWGNSLRSGHFVTYLKNESGQRWLLDDTNSKLSSLQEANAKDNYLVLLKKKDYIDESQWRISKK